MLFSKTRVSKFGHSHYLLLPKELLNDSQFPQLSLGKEFTIIYEAKKKLLMVQL